MTPTGSDDNVISFVYLDPSESRVSGAELEEELGTLAVSAVTSDGFELSWRLKAHGVYDSLTVEYRDTRSWDVREVELPGDATGSRIEGLKASTEYRVKLNGITSRQKSALLEAVAVTGISFSFRPTINQRRLVLVLRNSFLSNQIADVMCMLFISQQQYLLLQLSSARLA